MSVHFTQCGFSKQVCLVLDHLGPISPSLSVFLSLSLSYCLSLSLFLFSLCLSLSLSLTHTEQSKRCTGVPFKSRNILAEPAVREAVKVFS
jgi:hypothetical protein